MSRKKPQQSVAMPGMRHLSSPSLNLPCSPCAAPLSSGAGHARAAAAATAGCDARTASTSCSSTRAPGGLNTLSGNRTAKRCQGGLHLPQLHPRACARTDADKAVHQLCRVCKDIVPCWFGRPRLCASLPCTAAQVTTMHAVEEAARLPQLGATDAVAIHSNTPSISHMGAAHAHTRATNGLIHICTQVGQKAHP